MNQRLMTIRIDDRLHAQFKAVCASSGVNMSEIVIKFIQEFNNTYKKDQND